MHRACFSLAYPKYSSKSLKVCIFCPFLICILKLFSHIYSGVTKTFQKLGGISDKTNCVDTPLKWSFHSGGVLLDLLSWISMPQPLSFGTNHLSRGLIGNILLISNCLGEWSLWIYSEDWSVYTAGAWWDLYLIYPNDHGIIACFPHTSHKAWAEWIDEHTKRKSMYIHVFHFFLPPFHVPLLEAQDKLSIYLYLYTIRASFIAFLGYLQCLGC